MSLGTPTCVELRSVRNSVPKYRWPINDEEHLYRRSRLHMFNAARGCLALISASKKAQYQAQDRNGDGVSNELHIAVVEIRCILERARAHQSWIP